MTSAGLSVQGLSAHWDDLHVLEGLSFTVEEGQFTSIVGPSGCGKSSTFAALTGEIPLESGNVSVAGRPVVEHGREFAWMPQSGALLPWRSALDNATLGLELSGTPRAQARERALPFLEGFGLEGFEDSWPSELSGGMAQRVALLRTVLMDRPVLLLDEPFGALDALTRRAMQDWLERLWEKHRWTVVLITHDVREAVFLSDRVFVYSDRPAAVAATVEIDIPRPRRLELIQTPQFARMESEILTHLSLPPSGSK